MKKIILPIIMAAVAAVSAHAEYTNDGFYRVHNYDTDRYIYVYDNTGKVDLTGTTVDLYAIQLWKGLDRAISDPASVLYIEKHDAKYDIKTQGTGIHQMINEYVSLRPDSKIPGTYWAYGSSNGLTKYLCDGSSNPGKEQSWMVGEGTARRNWYITPVDASTSNYFGVQPTIVADDANWAALYADFSFTFASAGMEAWYVKSIDDKRGLAVMEQIASGAVNNAVPVIIKCAGESKSDNRLSLAMNQGTKPADNLCKGVYFNYDDVASHTNHVAFNRTTMRVLGATRDGHIGLTSPAIDYVPRNSFYVTVPAGTPSDVRLVTQAEYDDIVAKEVPQATSLTLDATEMTLTIGDTKQLTATVQPADAAENGFTWTSSDASVASVSVEGLVTARAAGTATITVKCGSLSASCKVTVNPILVTKILLNPESMVLKLGEEGFIYATVSPSNATNKQITWTSSNPTVATVDAEGKVVANNPGETVIMASCGSVEAYCHVEVKTIEVEEITLNAEELSILPGSQWPLFATVKPADAVNKEISWLSSDEAVATVSSFGTVKGVAPGECVITAVCGHASATCHVVVEHIETRSVKLNQRNAEIEVDSVLVLTATISPENATRPVVWASSDETVVTVDDQGNVTAIAAGQAVVTVTCGSKSDSCTIVVKDGSGITDIVIDGTTTFDVYNIQGVKVRTAVSSLQGLPAGLYIVGTQKYLVK